MNIQEKLEKWAEKTVDAYHQIAKREDVNIAYYTQSDLSLLVEMPELMIVGINPGNPYGITPYTEQCKTRIGHTYTIIHLTKIISGKVIIARKKENHHHGTIIESGDIGLG